MVNPKQWLPLLSLVSVIHAHLESQEFLAGVTGIDQRYDGAEGDLSNLGDLLSLHRELVSIPSVSNNELDVAIFLRDYLETEGLEVELQPVAAQDSTNKSRFNVFAYSPRHRETPLLLTSHVDTVPPYIPYSSKGDHEIWGTSV